MTCLAPAVAAFHIDLARFEDPRSGAVGSVIWHFGSLPSTNSLLTSLVTSGRAQHGAVVVADEQTGGRGRQGRSWLASHGSGLLISVYLLGSDPWALLSLSALATRESIAEAVGEPVQVKWPNDLLLRSKKVAGILLEHVRDGAVVGIGVNVNMDHSEVGRIGAEATSLNLTAGRFIDRTALLAGLLIRLEEQYERSRRSPRVVFDEWRAALVTLGREVEVQTTRESWVGRAVDVAEDGSLLVTKDRRIVRVYAGDVRVRRT